MSWIYLDHGASTPLDPEVAAALAAHQQTCFANPNSVHPLGQASARVLEQARTRLARVIHAEPAELTFTSGGTESLCLALLGGADDAGGRVAHSAVEHASVVEGARWLATHRGMAVDVVPVDREGRVTPAALAACVGPETRVVAIMMANNEVGTLNDIPALAAVVRAQAPQARLVVDAVQALGKVPLDVRTLGADHVAIAAHKIHGPKGIGALWSAQPFQPTFKGGGQEGGLRGGTQSVPLAWAFALAAERHLADMPHVTALRDRLWLALRDQVPDVAMNGPSFGPERLGNNLHVRVPGLPSRVLLDALAERGVYASAGSACGRGSFSRVLGALGFQTSDGAFIRLTIGRFTTEAEVDEAAARFGEVVAILRRAQ